MKSLFDEIKDTQQKQSEQDEANAAILLNQMDIMAKQEEQDQVLAEILLNGLGV